MPEGCGDHLYIITLDGEHLIAEPGSVAGPERALILEIRMMLRDPAGCNNIIFADDLPDPAEPGAAYCRFDFTPGKYERYNFARREWEALPLKISDAYILRMLRKHRSITKTAVALLDFLIAGLSTGAVSFSAGSESVTLPALGDVLNFYKYLRQIKLEEFAAENNGNTGRYMRMRRRAVGGAEE